LGRIVETLRDHRRVGIDTPVFIYHLEGESRYAGCVADLFSALAAGSFQGVTSVLTLMELAVKPLQLGRPEVVDEYEVLLLNYPNLEVVPIDRNTTRRAAELRAAHKLRSADALQVAACWEHGATAFLSNDRGLRRVARLEILPLDDYLED